MQLAKLIKQIRRTRNLTQADLAKMLGTTRNHVSYLEAGQKLPSLDVLERLGDVFGCNPYWIKGLWLRDNLTRFEEKLKSKSGLL